MTFCLTGPSLTIRGGMLPLMMLRPTRTRSRGCASGGGPGALRQPRDGAELDVPVDLAVDLAQLPGRLQRLEPAAHVAVSNRFSFWRHTHSSPEVAAFPLDAKRVGYGRFSGLDKGTVPRNYPLFIKSA